MAFLGLGAAGAAGGAGGAGLAGSTAAGLGTAGGLGLGGAAATPALSLAAAPAGSTLASGALGAGIPAIGSGASGMTAAGLGGGISTAGGIAPQLMQGAGQGDWWGKIMGGLNKASDTASGALNSPLGQAATKDKQTQPAPDPGNVPMFGGGGAPMVSNEDRINKILSGLFGVNT